jgi:hypothetical protein
LVALAAAFGAATDALLAGAFAAGAAFLAGADAAFAGATTVTGAEAGLATSAANAETMPNEAIRAKINFIYFLKVIDFQ